MTNPSPIKRTYAPQKIEAGDYVLLGNSGKYVYRIKRRVEWCGTNERTGKDQWAVRWFVYRWLGSVAAFQEVVVDQTTGDGYRAMFDADDDPPEDMWMTVSDLEADSTSTRASAFQCALRDDVKLVELDAAIDREAESCKASSSSSCN